MRRRCRQWVSLTLLVLGLPVSGCSKDPVRPSTQAPSVRIADSPLGAAYRFQYAYRNRSVDLYRTLFTSDFTFVFSALDVAGIPYRDHPWGRTEELACADSMFVTGTQGMGVVTSVTLDLASTPTDSADIRVGRDPRVHRRIDARVVVAFATAQGIYEDRGLIRLYVVRGDSASIPSGLGATPDSTRWYIQTWEDGTYAGGFAAVRVHPSRAAPADYLTWGRFKTFYLPAPVVVARLSRRGPAE
jgi:hypothetical protein